MRSLPSNLRPRHERWRNASRDRAAHIADGLRWSECVAPLRKVAREPWRWRIARGARERGRLVTQDIAMLLDDRDQEVARLRADRDELTFLRKHTEELEAIVRHKDLVRHSHVSAPRLGPVHFHDVRTWMRTLDDTRASWRGVRAMASIEMIPPPDGNAVGAVRRAVSDVV